MNQLDKLETTLFDELANLIKQSRGQLVSHANSVLTVLF